MRILFWVFVFSLCFWAVALSVKLFNGIQIHRIVRGDGADIPIGGGANGASTFTNTILRSNGIVPEFVPDKPTNTIHTSQPLKWGDLLSVDEDLNLVRVTPESVRRNMDRIAEIGGSRVGDPKNNGATILHVGHMRTNYHFTTNFTGTIQVGTNFYTVKELSK